MIDQYKAWLEERVAFYKNWALEVAAERGSPGNIRYADPEIRENIDSYQECLDKLNEMLDATPPPPR